MQMYSGQMNLFSDTIVRPSKKQRIVWGFQAHTFVLGLVLFFFAMPLSLAIFSRTTSGFLCAFTFGWWASRMFPPLWKGFLLFTLLRFPVLKAKWRVYIRPQVIVFNSFRASL
jgi:hypothetical protein